MAFVFLKKPGGKRGGGGTSASAPARIISPSYDRYDRPVENSIRGRVPGPDHLSIKIVIRFAELHHHEHLWFIRQEPKIGKFYLFCSPGVEAGLVALKRRGQYGL